MLLIDLIYPQNQIVSIVGTFKNAGKTVTLNEIISQAEQKGIALGLISTGRDGERRDVLTDTEKPPIYVKKGTYITTVEGAVKGVSRSDFAGIEILQVTDYNTPMGRVILGRTREEGYVEISGPHSSASIRKMCEEMLNLGAELVLIDGSLDRRSSAAPYISDGTVLATGAALARSLNTVIDKTLHIIHTYSIPRVSDDSVRALTAKIIDEGKTALIDKDGAIKYLDILTSLQCGDIISENLEEATEYVVLSGSATTETIKTLLMNKKSCPQIIVLDPTRIFIEPKDFSLLQRMGMKLLVVDNIKIIAITVNPYAPDGYYFDADMFLNKMRQAVPNTPVFDVMRNGGSICF